MSEKNSAANHAPKAIDTLVGAGMRIEGDIACTGVLRVQGEILGNVSCLENPNATLMVDGAGNVAGTVRASHIIARGRIVGPVHSPQSIEVLQGGSIAGDVSYKTIAIHAGGAVDGLLRQVVVAEVDQPVPTGRAPESAAIKTDAAAGGFAARLGGARAAVVVAIAVAAGAGIWLTGHPELLARHSGDAATTSDSVPKSTEARVSAAPAAEPQVAAKPAEGDAAPPLAPSLAVAPAEASASTSPNSAEKSQDKVVAVRGINPSRPPGAFLLVSNEQSVLYRKKNGEPGEGARIIVPGGEKVSVAIASDELIRVAQGRDVVILYQGKKVSRDVVESGAWISFVPR